MILLIPVQAENPLRPDLSDLPEPAQRAITTRANTAAIHGDAVRATALRLGSVERKGRKLLVFYADVSGDPDEIRSQLRGPAQLLTREEAEEDAEIAAMLPTGRHAIVWSGYGAEVNDDD